MNKYIILALLFVPMAAFAAPSIRVLGEKNPTTTNAGAISARAAKLPVSAGAGSSVARVGTLKSNKANTVTTATKTTTSNDSRFPAISSNHIYTSVGTPKPVNPTTIVNNSVDVDEDAIVQRAVNQSLQQVSQNYYNQTEIDNMLPGEDPRVDMIAVGAPGELSAAKLRKRWEDRGVEVPDNYIFMWIEDAD